MLPSIKAYQASAMENRNARFIGESPLQAGGDKISFSKKHKSIRDISQDKIPVSGENTPPKISSYHAFGKTMARQMPSQAAPPAAISLKEAPYQGN